MRAGTVFSGIAAGLVWGIAAQAAGAAETPPPRVPVDSVKMVREAAPKRYVGSVESIRHVDIMPRITGDLRKVHFREGEMVRQGELLYELEDTTYKAAVDKLKAQKEALGAARLYAAAEYKRNSTLLESNAVAVAAYDKAQLEIDSARANLKELDAENRAVRRKVETGGVAEGLQIIRSGLDGSETILIDGTHKIRPGMTVTPVPAATPAAR